MIVTSFHGMSRSGNHVIIHWAGYSRQGLYLNDMLRRRRYALERGADLPPARFTPSVLQALSRRSLRKLFLELPRLARGRIVVSLEDWPLDRPVFATRPRRQHEILILRDAPCLLASRVRARMWDAGGSAARSASEAVAQWAARWKQHAREFLGETRHLPGHCGILYDRWIADPAYRAALAERLGIVPDEAALSIVPPQGGGSSFEGMAPLGADAVTRRLSRFDMLSEEEKALCAPVLADPEIAALRTRLFHRAP